MISNISLNFLVLDFRTAAYEAWSTTDLDIVGNDFIAGFCAGWWLMAKKKHRRSEEVKELILHINKVFSKKTSTNS